MRFFPVSYARPHGLKNDRILLFLYMQIVIITRKEETRARARNFPAIYKPIHKRFPPRFFFFIFFYSRIRARGTGHGKDGAEESESIYFLTPALLRARVYVCLCVYRVFHPVHFTMGVFQLIFEQIDLSLLNQFENRIRQTPFVRLPYRLWL